MIYEGKGPVHDTFAKESEFKKKKKEELKQKIDEIEAKKSTSPFSIKRRRLSYVGMYVVFA